MEVSPAELDGIQVLKRSAQKNLRKHLLRVFLIDYNQYSNFEFIKEI